MGGALLLHIDSTNKNTGKSKKRNNERTNQGMHGLFCREFLKEMFFFLIKFNCSTNIINLFLGFL